jgi:hypothetical protein
MAETNIGGHISLDSFLLLVRGRCGSYLQDDPAYFLRWVFHILLVFDCVDADDGMKRRDLKVVR